MLEISNELKARFCKDCKIPIGVFDEPYFTDRITLYDRFYNSLEKYALFIKELYKYDSEQDYFDEYNRVKDEAINYIKSTEAYQRFNSEDMNKFAVTHKDLPTKDIFKPSFDGEHFISIDIMKANFHCLRHYDESMFGGAYTWEDFISKYTDNKHIINSKYIRQVILGNCNPKRHITYEKHIMDKVLKIVIMLVDMKDIVLFSNDEIVIKSDDYSLTFEIAKFLENYEIPLRIKGFTLHKIGGLDGYYKLYDFDSTVELKCIDSFMLPFVLRKLQNQDIEDSDRVFFHEGLRAQVIDLPEITI